MLSIDRQPGKRQTAPNLDIVIPVLDEGRRNIVSGPSTLTKMLRGLRTT
jgi:hypothetical protein